MDEALISKKDLLEITGISYGQLYRWKRKNLIPEDWFIRKSTFTGQETFFPKNKILGRIDKIINMKEDLSLDDIADMFSPNNEEFAIEKKDVIERNIVSNVTMDFFISNAGDSDIFDFERILFLYILEKLLKTGEVSLEESKDVLQMLMNNYGKFLGKNCELVIIRKLGVSTCILMQVPNEVYFETNIKIVSRLNLSNCIEELKIRII
ncbi:MAG: YhbD family protein [Bacillota bacterium]|nr:YhbD family protein [Bacillota bacterium]